MRTTNIYLWTVSIIKLLSSIFLSMTFLLISFSSCTEDKDNGIKDPTTPEQPKPEDPDNSANKYQFKLATKENNSNIFDLTTFSIYNKKEGDVNVSFAELKEVYDSISWTVSKHQGRLKVFSVDKGDGFEVVNLKTQWSHSFYLPGLYDTYLHCYKDNRIVHSDTLAMNITNKKDFLMYDWSEIIGSNQNSTSYNNALDDKYILQSSKRVLENISSIRLQFWNNNEDDVVFAKKCLVKFNDYICSIYNKPSFDINSPDLITKYNELFSHREPSATPHAIWLTAKNKIVLLSGNINETFNKTWVRAEPR